LALSVKIRSRLLTRIAGGIAAGIFRLLFRTCRVKVFTDTEGISPYEETGARRFLYCIWHDQLVMTIFSGRPRRMAGLVSQHQDGSYLADAMQVLGITPVRGSTNRGGGRALRELIERTKELHVAITPDGPRGPRHELKSGIVFLASHTGRGIVPTAYTCRRCWKFRGSWTDMMIPKPFTTVFVRGGAPLYVPSDLSRDELEQHRLRLQIEMARLEAEAEALARGEGLPMRDTVRKAA
jgi:lysophospholipid acyltransferase (LPLAT)-like uncharacterized protein